MRGALPLGVALLALAAFRPAPSAPRAGGGAPAVPASPLTLDQYATTDPSIALANLEAAIDALEGDLAEGRLPAKRLGELVDLLLTRGQLLGRISDYERAAALAERFVREAPADGASHLARASASSTFHRFPEALGELEEAARLGARNDLIDSSRAAILQATGRYVEALAIRHRLARGRPNILSIGAEASVLAESGEIEAAERRFADAQASYGDVSPFPLAWLHFQQGRMWMRAGNLERARQLFEAARARLPRYSAATGHLGEVEAALGRRDRAIELLRAAAESSDDPDAAGHLARVLEEAGQRFEASGWRGRAAARYSDLVARHPEAFADHGAEFWLGAGGDPKTALVLARRNLAVRETPASYELAAKAALAAGEAAEACEAAERALGFGHVLAPLRELAGRAFEACGRSSKRGV